MRPVYWHQIVGARRVRREIEMANTNEALPTAQTLADVVTDEDKLFRDGYVRGVAEFIKSCATPMTLAIQGDLGAGKSSLINLIEAELRAQTKPGESEGKDTAEYCEEIINVATVDVWQHSVANPGTSMFDIVLAEMMSHLSGTDLSSLKNIYLFTSLASDLLDEVFGGKDESKDKLSIRSILASIFSLEDEEPEKEDSFVSDEDVEACKTALIEALQQSAKANGKSEDARLVVFVDGLDHINPEAVVDFLGQVKTYLNFPHCVFVFAVDEKIVHDGIRKKLGDKTDDARRKAYFDMLIQVPLSIPTSAYSLNKYVEDLLKDERELSAECVKVIRALVVEPTPRNIKRCINTMYLYRNIFSGSASSSGSLGMLLAAVILKFEGTQGFDTVASCAEGSGTQFTESLKSAVGSLGLTGGINWVMLPTLWCDEEGAGEDAAKRDAFISWVRKLK